MTTFSKSPRFPIHHSTPTQPYRYWKKSQIPRRVHTPTSNMAPTRPPTPYYHMESFSSILTDEHEPPLTMGDLKNQSMSEIVIYRGKVLQRAELMELVRLLETKVGGLEVAYQAARDEIEVYKSILEKHLRA